MLVAMGELNYSHLMDTQARNYSKGLEQLRYCASTREIGTKSWSGSWDDVEAKMVCFSQNLVKPRIHRFGITFFFFFFVKLREIAHQTAGDFMETYLRHCWG